ncbi:MAG TPA: 6-carboxytetrahydropterin synthase, partial [Thermodesulfobacteriota bacterium]|nr:6-carboxytetrahydropterin synthase [Thermodesulfobacteriota bacterium]
MYSVAVRQAFSASHYLIGDDWGEESKLHQHDYLVEVCLEGQHLDAHFYLADISDIKVRLNGLVDSVRG